MPKSPDVLGATKLLLLGQRQSLSLKAPGGEGENEFFCTFPGHYQVMWGTLVVAKNVDEYFKAHPGPRQPGPEAAASSAHNHEVIHNN